MLAPFSLLIDVAHLLHISSLGRKLKALVFHVLCAYRECTNAAVTRAGEQAFGEKHQLMQSLKSQRLQNWVCKFTSATPETPRGSDSDYYFGPCGDADGKQMYADFTFKMPKRVGEALGKVYQGDIISFSGKPIYASSGAGLGYSLEIYADEIKVLKK